MAWKDWPYWLKGGIIGVIVMIILASIVFSSMYVYQEKYDAPNEDFSLTQMLSVSASFMSRVIPLYLLFGIVPGILESICISLFQSGGIFMTGEFIPFPTILGIIINAPIYFLIGALFGLLFQKKRKLFWVFISIITIIIILSLIPFFLGPEAYSDTIEKQIEEAKKQEYMEMNQFIESAVQANDVSMCNNSVICVAAVGKKNNRSDVCESLKDTDHYNPEIPYKGCLALLHKNISICGSEDIDVIGSLAKECRWYYIRVFGSDS
jgi:hypothetical protein